MELLLWRWSTAVQIASDLVIAGFFVALALSMRRAELRPWVRAWIANLLALTVTTLFWLLQPRSPVVFSAAAAVYLLAKSLFVLWLVEGARTFLGVRQPLLTGRRMLLLAACCVAGGVLVQGIPQLGALQSLLILLVLGGAAVHLLRAGGRQFAWLATGFALRALFASATMLAYATLWLGGEWAQWPLLSAFIASHSSFDTGAEWVIALGCVLTLYGAIQRELTQSNQALQSAQRRLQDLLHRDQLTGVFNRRALPVVLSEASESGATLLFIDLDRFKRINDAHGHQAGDECLKRAARALREAFGSGDRIVRYAGDEFVVVTAERDPAAIDAALAAARALLDERRPEDPAVTFSVGVASLPPGGDPEEVLRSADLAMYTAKDYERRREPVPG